MRTLLTILAAEIVVIAVACGIAAVLLVGGLILLAELAARFPAR